MTELLQQVIAKISELTDEEQDAIAAQILATLEKSLSSSSAVPEPPHDALFQLAGCIESEYTDISINHDHYLGQALQEDMRCSE
ncbi:MAG: hypothetical protein F6K09_09370 [Merismopedia sp. SIO2A8]|nr:hypothetical protein [Merismopedia sp. SIO2A8]